MLAYFVPSQRCVTRRAILLGAAALAGCARRKSRGFPGYAFVANAAARTVAAVDLNSFALVKQIGLEGAPGAVRANPRGPGVYVLIPESGSVCQIDAATLAVVRKTRLGSPALVMRLAADAKSLWVLQSRALVRLEDGHLRVARQIRLPGAATDFDLASDGHAAVCFGGDRRLALIRLSDGATEHLIDVGDEPSMVRFLSDGKQVLAGSRAGRSLTIFDTATGRTAVRLPLPVEPANCCFTGDGGQMFVTRPRHGCRGDRVSLSDRSGRNHSGRAHARWLGRLRLTALSFRGESGIGQRDGARHRYAQTGGFRGGGSGAPPYSDHAG